MKLEGKEGGDKRREVFRLFGAMEGLEALNTYNLEGVGGVFL